MNGKKWIKIFMALSILGVSAVGIINYIVDPFQQYRAKTFYPIAFLKERYQNAGLSKNLDYDSVVLGTSTSENFILNEVEDNLNCKKALKLSVKGGSAREQSITLKTAIKNNKNLKHVLWGLDSFVFIGEANRLKSGPGTFPEYLYDSNILNDYKYLLSIDTLLDSFKSVSRPYLKKDKSVYDYNKMYQWQHQLENDFTFEKIIEAWENRDLDLDEELDKQSFSYLKNSFDINFMPIIKNNKQIEFKIFFPPYSILHFKGIEERNSLDDTFKFERYIFNQLKNYPNIKMYDFQINKKLTHNLANYRDLIHYHQKFNTWIVEQIKNDKYLITEENIDKNLRELDKQIKNYNLKKELKR
ncbi:MAG: hypothetical protein C0625_13745 [Arcobacter sp.]|nr:MAG: hypothetical protein C0625_13745 [Arcobacter sp.]